MKKTNFFLLLLIALSSFSAFAAEYRIRKVETLGDMNHRVIFQSRDLKKVKNSTQNHLTGKIVIMWGTEVFQVVDGLYLCSAKNFCKLQTYKHVATFRKCVVNRKKVDCTLPISGRDFTGESNDVRVFEDPDRVYDEYDNGRDSWDYSPEFPVRVNDEFDGMVLF